jgi:alkylation response protein AidB-like acyl-CoA dehydrogenase
MGATVNSLRTEEGEAIRSSARAFVRGRAPVAHLRALRDARDPVGYSRELWREMGGLGFAGMVIPERYGGGGLGFAELGLVFEELGRNLVPTPLLSTLLAGGAVLRGGTEALRQSILPDVCACERVMALAHEEGVRHAPYAVATRAERDRHGFVLHGEKSFVIDGHGADAFVVVGRTSGASGEREGLTLFHVPGGAPGLSTQRLDMVDSRNVARIRLDAVRVAERDVLGEIDRGSDVLDGVLSRAAAALAAEMLGGLEEAFDRTIAYLKTRKQFGVYIGSFQALKHRAAWMFCEVELTRSLVCEALRAIDADRDDAPLLASAAKARASDTFVLVANEAIQMHGGIGVTDELDVGLYLKRARVAAELLGGAAYHRERFAKLRGY